MRARLLLSCSVVLAACGGGAGAFGPAVRVLEARDVDAVIADGRGAVCVASGELLNRADGSVLAIADGGAAVALARRLDDPRQPVLAGDDVYFLTDDGVFRVARAGGADPVRLAPLTRPGALALVGGELVIGLADTIVALPPDGAARALVGNAGAVGALAVAGDRLLWLDRAGGRVMRARLDGTDVTVLADGQAEPAALAVAGDAVVWVTQGDTAKDIEATVATVPIAGGQVRVLHRGGYEYEGVTIHRGWVYWTWGDAFSSVQRVRLAGGKAQTVVGDQTDLDGIAVDDGGLWIGGGDGLYRARRK
jgi:hypothetical protein